MKIYKFTRSCEPQAKAFERGRQFHKRIYGRNPEFDTNATPLASPDYEFVVRDLIYGHIFSFPGILDDIETGFVIISALIGLDCQIQLRNQIKGLIYNGASEADVQWVQKVCQDLIMRLGVTFRSTRKTIEVGKL